MSQLDQPESPAEAADVSDDAIVRSREQIQVLTNELNQIEHQISRLRPPYDHGERTTRPNRHNPVQAFRQRRRLRVVNPNTRHFQDRVERRFRRMQGVVNDLHKAVDELDHLSRELTAASQRIRQEAANEREAQRRELEAQEAPVASETTRTLSLIDALLGSYKRRQARRVQEARNSSLP